LDEDGRHLPGYSKTVLQNPGDPSFPAMNNDLSDFATLLIRKFFSIVHSEYKLAAPNYMQLSTNFSDVPDFVLK
jgi:hypothetical protein